ncbi:MAG TPA: undecaprenyl-diphosphate phosphatase [Phycisphaerae bacterium]|nr:undecaprenyl-diphosphate phosphatase [Phycisphaerae bacterium]
MGDSLRAVILGIIEGLTEFLPVSSTGHMILAMSAMGIDGEKDPWSSFLYVIQIGAILAVVVYFFQPLRQQLLHRPDRGWSNHMLTKLAVGTLPAVVIGLPLNDIAEKYLEKPMPVTLAQIGGAIVMVLIERRHRGDTGPGVEAITLRQALWVGLGQCVAIIPGTSRSMATIMGGLLVGMSRRAAAEFSFYLAIPTLLGAGLLRAFKHRHALMGANALTLAIGFGVAFIVAWIVVAAFMAYIRTRPLWPFAIYRVLLGLFLIGWFVLS